ncbi:hypothetical protein WA577_006014, partial [Blastocystis sp. JDR]
MPSSEVVFASVSPMSSDESKSNDNSESPVPAIIPFSPSSHSSSIKSAMGRERRKRLGKLKPEKQRKAEYFLSHIAMGGEGEIQNGKDTKEDEKKGESTVSGKQNYEFKGIDVLRKPTTQLKSGLYVLSPKKHFPLSLTSIIGVEDEDEKDALVSSPSDSDEELLLYEKMNNVRRNKEPDKILNTSYQSFLKSYTAENTENIYLDNAYIQQSSQTSIFFFNGWISSVIPYIKETQLKEELNRIFQDNYPDIPKSFTLSKLRKIKHLALMLCAPSMSFPSIHTSLRHCPTVPFDIGTLALAFCYFERLVLYGHVNKENRKVVCADCCLIAYKFNQLAEAEGQEKTEALRVLLEELNTLFGVEPEKILEMETEVLVTLEFSLLVPYDQYTDHIFWILRKMDTNIQMYLGEEMYESYRKAIDYEEFEGGAEGEEEVDSHDGEEAEGLEEIPLEKEE